MPIIHIIWYIVFSFEIGTVFTYQNHGCAETISQLIIPVLGVLIFLLQYLSTIITDTNVG